MAKDKKGGAEAKKAKKAEKKQKQEKKAKAKASKQQDAGSDAEDVDLDQVLEDYRRQQEQFLKITETVADGPPRARSASCFLASPSNANQLLLFGGEYFNGSTASFFNDLHIYYIDRDEWRTVTSPNAPLPRSGHAWCRGGNQAQVYLFGGEFSSPKQGTFYHYNDFWRLEPASREWTRLEPKGKTPPARSGHRLCYFKQYILLFGGFQDTANSTKYLADLWIYDTVNFVWYNPVLPPAQLKPDARSSFTFLPHEQGAVLYGGYSRVKASVAVGGKQGKGSGGGQLQKNILKPLIHQDCFFLRITPPAAGAAANTPPMVRWERRKKPANAPNPARAGTTMAYHKGRGLLFGGVHDVEESEEGIDSEFFKQLFAWNIERNRFFPLVLRKPRARGKPAAGGASEARGGRRGRAQANEEELLKQLAALRAGASLQDVDSMEIDTPDDDQKAQEVPVREMPVSMDLPHERFNALLAVQGDVLYIYGGTFEKGDREFTFDDMYSIDIGKLDGCTEIFSRPVEDWIVSTRTYPSSEIDELKLHRRLRMKKKTMRKMMRMATKRRTRKTKMGTSRWIPQRKRSISRRARGSLRTRTKPMPSPPHHRARRRKTTISPKQTQLLRVLMMACLIQEYVYATHFSFTSGILTRIQPFESLREFYIRTSNEWQEVLLEGMRTNGIKSEGMTIKELKAKAFELCDEKWWDCREEITALEDEQEAAGIGEVVSLADRGNATGAGAGAAGVKGGARRR
jgi:hypothetical protein